jgi:hypothetical protein
MPLNSHGSINNTLIFMPVRGGDTSLINGDSSSSNRSMSLSEVVSAGVLVFSFTLHSCFVSIIGQMVLKCLYLSFSVASSLSFCALIYWILLVWLGMSPVGHQRGVGVIPGVMVLDVPLFPKPGEIGWSGLGK